MLNDELTTLLTKLATNGDQPAALAPFIVTGKGSPGSQLRGDSTSEAFDAVCAVLAARGWTISRDPQRPWTDDRVHHIIADAFGFVVGELPRWQDVGVYLDALRDTDGHHRVYLRDEQTIPGNRWAWFANLTEACRWMVRSDRGQDAPFPDNADDHWETTAGGVVFDEAADLLTTVLAGYQLADEPEPLAWPAPADPPEAERLFLVSVLEHAATNPDTVRQLAASPRTHALSPEARRLLLGLPKILPGT